MSWAAFAPDAPIERSPRDEGRAPPVVEELDWTVAHDRASVERFLDEVAAERLRLVDAIAAANARTERARERGTKRAALERELAAFLYDAQHELAKLEREHAALLAEIVDDADARARALIERAHAGAAEVRATAESLARMLPSDGRGTA